MPGELGDLRDVETGACEVCQSQVAQCMRAEAWDACLGREGSRQQTPSEAANTLGTVPSARRQEQVRVANVKPPAFGEVGGKRSAGRG